MNNPNPKTLYDKLWDTHFVGSRSDNGDLLYIDLHMVHEVTSPQAFEGLKIKGIGPRRVDSIVATVDHNVPTTDRSEGLKGIKDSISRDQIQALQINCHDFGIDLIDLNDLNQGIVHVVGPEQGFTQPGMTIVCGDSHTSTHGAFGCLAMGIGTSEVEHVLATQCLVMNKQKNMRISINGPLKKNVFAKDLTMFLIGKIGTAGGTGHVIEYDGSTIESLSMEGRMTVCNMAIEAGARAGMIAPDQKTFDYLKSKPHSPKGNEYEIALEYWKTFHSDENSNFDTVHNFFAEEIEPQVTWGTSPEMVIGVKDRIPSKEDYTSQTERNNFETALDYMGLSAGDSLENYSLDQIFIGSCTNSRIEDLRIASNIVKGKKKSDQVNAWVIPGSKSVEKIAIEEGLDKIFNEAGFEFRQPGCSACLAMNEDKIPQGKYCVSTSNRNFEGRQGPGSRTFLASPATAALTALNGFITDIRDYN